MAKIIYFISPFDESKKTEIISKGTLRYAMRELGIEHDPVAVIINGMNPDEVDMDMVLDDTDIVEIRRVVNGGGKSENKSIAATVIQIVAVVAATVVGQPWVAAAILAGGAVAAGALNKWAADLAAAENATDETKVDVSANNYSLTTANNQARQLRPIPLIMGSHRYAPDMHTLPFVWRYDTGVNSSSARIARTFQTGLVQSNGPMAPNNSWAVMPANFISAGLPQYPIKIMPYGFTTKTSTLTPAENDDIINTVKFFHETFPSTNWTRQFLSPNPLNAYPLVIYHFDPSDPYVGRFNLFFSLQRAISNTATGLGYGVLTNLFNGTFPANGGYFFYRVNSGGPYSFPSYAYATCITDSESLTIPSGFPATGSGAAQFSAYGSYLLSLNSGSYTTTPKTTAPSTLIYMYQYTFTSVKQGIPFARQLFNFGFGDLSNSERKIGGMDILPSSADTVNYSSINKTNPSSIDRWRIPNTTASWGSFRYYNDFISIENKKLLNYDSTTSIINADDNNTYNWIYLNGAPRLNAFQFAIQGRLYNATGSGISANTTTIQMHWKNKNQSSWNEFDQSVINVTNSSTNEIYIPYDLGNLPYTSLNDSFVVRIRKVTLDSSDASGTKVSDLSIVNACFYESEELKFDVPIFEPNAPMNIEGLCTTALITDSSTTNRFSALVQSKCWVYNFTTETWSWTFNRNPAFWFLYFARGGFYNFQSMGTYSPPYSPTYGWQNYAGHPNNTSHIFGGGYTDDKLDMDKILEWAFFCEENNLKLDLVLKDEESVADTLEKIANVGRASVTYYGGTLSVVFEDPEQVPVCMFGMGNILAGSFAVDYSVGDPVRRVRAQFVNRENWETEEVESLVPFSDPEIVKEIEMTFVGITEKSQAQREVNILAARQYYQKRTYTFRVDWEGLLARRGDLAFLSHDSTQYGYSGRVNQFVVESGVVIGIKSSAIVDTDISYVSVYSPNGSIDTYTCELDGGMIRFTETYPIEKAPFYVNLDDENPDSDFIKSIAEDFHFIADIKETTGKKVRISSIEVDSDYVFTITAVDEDPAMWAYEYGDPVTSTSFNDSVVTLEVVNLRSLDLGQGKIRLLWDMNGGDFAQVINLNTGLPLEANGQYSFSEGDVIFELTSGIQYELEVLPMAIGTPYKSISQKVKVWPL